MNEIWIVTNGVYDDAVVIGAATSEAEAAVIIANAKNDAPGIYDADFSITGPIELNRRYGRNMYEEPLG